MENLLISTFMVLAAVMFALLLTGAAMMIGHTAANVVGRQIRADVETTFKHRR